jgi:hypothetical protein
LLLVSANGLFSPPVWPLLYILTAGLGLKNMDIKENAFMIRARSTEEMSQKDEI